jgi:four helix bundle protein
MSLRRFNELIVWQRAMDLVVAIYDATKVFPREEIYTLTSQVRRAAISIRSNIAEGQGRQTTNDFRHFLSISRGSLAEVETQILLAERLGYLAAEPRQSLCDTIAEVGRLLNGLINSLNRD